MAKVALVTGGSRGIGAAISSRSRMRVTPSPRNYAGNDEAAAAHSPAETGIQTLQVVGGRL